jgi:hypothetical protein
MTRSVLGTEGASEGVGIFGSSVVANPHAGEEDAEDAEDAGDAEDAEDAPCRSGSLGWRP